MSLTGASSYALPCCSLTKEILDIYLYTPKKVKIYGTATAGTSASTGRVPFKKVFLRLRLT
jgi:hypothetical protein